MSILHQCHRNLVFTNMETYEEMLIIICELCSSYALQTWHVNTVPTTFTTITLPPTITTTTTHLLYFSHFWTKTAYRIHFLLLSYFTFKHSFKHLYVMLQKFDCRMWNRHHLFLCIQDPLCFSANLIVFSFLVSHLCVNLSTSLLRLLLMLPTFHLLLVIDLLVYHVLSYLMLSVICHPQAWHTLDPPLRQKIHILIPNILFIYIFPNCLNAFTVHCNFIVIVSQTVNIHYIDQLVNLGFTINGLLQAIMLA